jgi:hypothetical protein
MAIDTLKVARRLREAGFSEPQAEAVVAAVQEGAEGAEGADLATKADLALQGTELRAEMAALAAELRAEMAALTSQLRTEIQSIKTSIEAAKSEMLGRMLQMILGAVLVNFVAMLGVMFAFAKLLGH